MRTYISRHIGCVFKGFTSIFGHWYFYVLLIEGIIDNFLGYADYPLKGIHSNSFVKMMDVASFALIISYFETVIIVASQGVFKSIWSKFKIWYNPFLYLFVLCNGLVLIVDFFVFVNFGRVLDTGMLDIMMQTNGKESREFLSIYLGMGIIFACISILVVSFGIGLFLFYLRRKTPLWFNIFLSLIFAWGLLIAGTCVYKFARYRNSENLLQINSYTRFIYYGYIQYGNIKGIDNLIKMTVDYPFTEGGDGATIILIIGESHSVFHTSLYGYERETYPHLQKRFNDGSLIVFKDVVTIEDHTSSVMNSIYSYSRYNNEFYNFPLIPMVFNRAGYYTALYDNAYLAGEGQGFLSSEELSRKIFRYRNKCTYNYDGELVSKIVIPKNVKSFIIIHLMGQHYKYSERFPAVSDFIKFSSSDYKGTEHERRMKADYDNSCLYNDYVIDSVIKKCEGENCVVLYVSDHGEDVYEQKGIIGHGSAAYVPSLKYQIRVPMFIWGSKEFRERNVDIWNKIIQSASLPACSDDISHFLTDLAGLNVDELDTSRSIISEDYDSTRQRVVLHSIPYSIGK